MAEQVVTLQPSESKVVSFEAVPHEARTYQVSVNGLTGSFVAVEPPLPEFVYTSPLNRWEIDSLYDGWSVEVQNIGVSAAVCTVTFYDRMEEPGVTGHWASWKQKDQQVQEIQPGQIVTFSGSYKVRDYNHQFMVKSEAGKLLNPGWPLEFVCGICPELLGKTSDFDTLAELCDHVWNEHPQYTDGYASLCGW